MYFNNLKKGVFVQRINRFAAECTLGGVGVLAHVANSGRMGELFVAGRTVYLRPVHSEMRKTKYTLELVETENRELVSVNSNQPNRLFAEAFNSKRLFPFSQYNQIRSEVTAGSSRLDFKLSGPPGICYVEIKSVTLVVGETALFPDAPTLRGVKHINELIALHEIGNRTAVVFIVQRNDAQSIQPNDAADPLFGQTLRMAAKQGVALFAWRCHVSTKQVDLSEIIPVCI